MFAERFRSKGLCLPAVFIMSLWGSWSVLPRYPPLNLQVHIYKYTLVINPTLRMSSSVSSCSSYTEMLSQLRSDKPLGLTVLWRLIYLHSHLDKLATNWPQAIKRSHVHILRVVSADNNAWQSLLETSFRSLLCNGQARLHGNTFLGQPILSHHRRGRYSKRKNPFSLKNLAPWATCDISNSAINGHFVPSPSPSDTEAYCLVHQWLT